MTTTHDIRWSGAHWHCRTCDPERLVNMPIPGNFDQKPVCPNDKGHGLAVEPICKNCHQPTHPHYIHKYGGYCLDCANAGVPELRERITELEMEKVELENEKAELREALRPFADEYILFVNQARSESALLAGGRLTLDDWCRSAKVLEAKQ